MSLSTPYRQLLIRRDLEANIPTLAVGELFLATDTGHLWAGDTSGNVIVNIDYSPGAPSNWHSPPPATVASALDRLAAAVEGLLGGPIP